MPQPGHGFWPGQIISRLNNRFDLLSLRGTAAARGGTIPKRHQSLHAAIAWSYDLLGPSLQTFWARLSTFHGGWTAGAAQAVTGVRQVNEPLLLLAERSLILAEAVEGTDEVRYRMLESLREFAQEQARAMGQEAEAALRVRSARYFADLSRKANEMVDTGRGMRPALALLGPERDNLRAVFEWLREQTAEPESVCLRSADAISGIKAAIQNILQSHWLWPMNELRQYLSLAADVTALLPDDTGVLLRASVFSQQGGYAAFSGG